MFYHPTVLQRQTGCFSTIWLVATKGIKVTRRDFLKVNVKTTCDDIMSYVLERVPPPRPGLPRPRFSLYLSSQLQYGVVLVYHRQCAIFLEELQSILVQLMKQRPSQKIDMEEDRQALDITDDLALMEEAEGAPDPLFGVMFMQECIPSPNTLIRMGREHERGASPEQPQLMSPSPPSPPAPPAAPAADNGITASPESITLREPEPFTIPAAEFEGEELAFQSHDIVDILMAQTDDFPEGDLELPRADVMPGEPEREEERGGEEELEAERTKEQPGSTIESQPATASSEDAMFPLEEPDLSLEKPGPPSDLHTPSSVATIPLPPSAAQEPDRPTPRPKVRRRRKRQLVFFDPETQLAREVLQQQIDDPMIETRRPDFPLPPSHRRTTPAKLFSSPCTFLPEAALVLWSQAATIKPLSGSDLQVGERHESTDSEKERDREMGEIADMAEALDREEVPRGVTEPPEMFDISEQGSLPLERSDQRDVSREISPLPASEKEVSTVSRSASALQDIPEVDEQHRAESPGLLPDFMEHEGELVVFQSLLSPEVDRKTVGITFLRLLENLTDRKVRAEQEVPYGDIVILPGPNYNVGHLTL